MAEEMVEVCNLNDLKGLIDFKKGIHIDTFSRLKNREGRSCCEWEGISCDNSTGRVTEILLLGLIYFDGVPLQSHKEGWLSPSVTLLTSLEAIDFSELIVDSLRSSSSLANLDLHSNSISGLMPEKIEIPKSSKELAGFEHPRSHLNKLTGLLSSVFQMGSELPVSSANISSMETLKLQKKQVPW
ncbi:DNA damage-repair/toleration protein DRT100-like [Malania oleifera]|uniref:DNA damage-repair/toleration protein DRT100-like n=1 Tax=Malania oleifera TaxID=397392 RepID=UPI0025AE1443|nr:DNA damage-repair/toleration protein DRT100-like [Malania oleifera]